MVNIHVSHHDDGLIVGTIPLFIIVAQHLRLEVVNDAHQADGQAVAVFAAGEEVGQVLLVEPLAGIGTHLPLLMHHAALLVNLLSIKRETARPVFQHQQTRVEGRLAVGGHVADAIHRLINRGIGIEIATKFHSQCTGEVDDTVARKMLRPIESHVLQEVG